MEIMLQWFWLIKVLGAIVFVILGVIAYRTKNLGSRLMIILVSIVGLTFMLSVKMEQPTYTTQSNSTIESNKVLPEKVSDTSFQDEVNKRKGLK